MDRSKIIYTNYDEALSCHIKNGAMEAVRQLNYEDFSRNVGSFDPTQMRSLKNTLIVLNSICPRAAMSQYIIVHKIAEAKKPLRFTGKSLAEIACLLRFSSRRHFQRQFKKYGA